MFDPPEDGLLDDSDGDGGGGERVLVGPVDRDGSQSESLVTQTLKGRSGEPFLVRMKKRG